MTFFWSSEILKIINLFLPHIIMQTCASTCHSELTIPSHTQLVKIFDKQGKKFIFWFPSKSSSSSGSTSLTQKTLKLSALGLLSGECHCCILTMNEYQGFFLHHPPHLVYSIGREEPLKAHNAPNVVRVGSARREEAKKMSAQHKQSYKKMQYKCTCWNLNCRMLI